MLGVAVDTNHLSHPGQAHRRRVGRHAPQLTQFDSPVGWLALRKMKNSTPLFCVMRGRPSNVRMMFYHLGSKALLLSLEAALAKISS
jgi:hypothetical protein